MSSRPQSGEVFTTDGGFGYFVVMAVLDSGVVVSPLFWSEHPVLFFKSHRAFRDYKRHSGRINNATIQGRYDLELLRRWRWIALVDRSSVWTWTRLIDGGEKLIGEVLTSAGLGRPQQVVSQIKRRKLWSHIR